MALAGCHATNPWRPPEFLSQVRTLLRREKWRIALAPHPDRDFVEFILEGLESGFRVGFYYRMAECAKARGNMTSVCEDKNMISAFLNEECLVGPLDPRAFPSVRCSPIGLVPKGSTRKWRFKAVDKGELGGARAPPNFLSHFIKIITVQSRAWQSQCQYCADTARGIIKGGF